MLLHTTRGRVRFTDPTRQPRRAADALTGHLAGPRDMAALALLTSRDMLAPASRIRHRRDQSTLAALRRAGISGELIERLFRPFLAGVFLEEELETSSRFFHLVWRSMLRGSLCLPRHGIQAVPGQLAAALPPATIRLETPVSELTDQGVLLADGTERAADVVVVATGAAAAARLLPGLRVPATRTVTTVLPRGAVLAAGRADPAGGHRTPDPAHQRAERGHARIREQRPRAGLHLGARDGRRERGTARSAPVWPPCTASTPRTGSTWLPTPSKARCRPCPRRILLSGAAASARAATSAAITGPPGRSRARWPQGRVPPARSWPRPVRQGWRTAGWAAHPTSRAGTCRRARRRLRTGPPDGAAPRR